MKTYRWSKNAVCVMIWPCHDERRRVNVEGCDEGKDEGKVPRGRPRSRWLDNTQYLTYIAF